MPRKPSLGQARVRMNRVRETTKWQKKVDAEHQRLADLFGLTVADVQYLDRHFFDIEYGHYRRRLRDSAIRAREAFSQGEGQLVLTHIVAYLQPELAEKDERYRDTIFLPLDRIRQRIQKIIQKESS